MSASPLDVVVVGCGRMGSALAEGAVRAGALSPARLFCIDANPAAATLLAERVGARVGAPTRTGGTAWIIAVKPQYVVEALRGLEIAAGDVVISVAAGVRRSTIRAAIVDGVSIVRAMPNTPALIAQGITGVLAESADVELTDALFGAVGEVVHLTDEAQFDAVTALSGSGPAYVFLAIEALADGGVAMGLPHEMAMRLAKQTVLGAAALATAQSVPVAELRDQVSSPGGTTVAGLAALDRGGFRAAIIDAVRAATERSRELGAPED